MSLESPVRVLLPWIEHPFRLISWYDMNKFSAERYLSIGKSLEWFKGLTEKGMWEGEYGGHSICRTMATKLSQDLLEIGCVISGEAAFRFATMIDHDKMPNTIFVMSGEEAKTRLDELGAVICDEMRRHLFFWVPPERAKFYEYPQDKNKWDETEKAIDGQISNRFKKAATEILSARKCYADAQYTPCVFHLMRACEAGIKALYQTLTVPAPKLSDSWGNLLKPMDEQLRKKPPDRYGEWAKQPDFFDPATNDIRAIKRAWRDTTMHIEANYDESGARKALDSVTSFFVHLSERLDQDGNVYQQAP